MCPCEYPREEGSSLGAGLSGPAHEDDTGETSGETSGEVAVAEADRRGHTPPIVQQFAAAYLEFCKMLIITKAYRKCLAATHF